MNARLYLKLRRPMAVPRRRPLLLRLRLWWIDYRLRDLDWQQTALERQTAQERRGINVERLRLMRLRAELVK